LAEESTTTFLPSCFGKEDVLSALAVKNEKVGITVYMEGFLVFFSRVVADGCEKGLAY